MYSFKIGVLSRTKKTPICNTIEVIQPERFVFFESYYSEKASLFGVNPVKNLFLNSLFWG